MYERPPPSEPKRSRAVRHAVAFFLAALTCSGAALLGVALILILLWLASLIGFATLAYAAGRL